MIFSSLLIQYLVSKVNILLEVEGHKMWKQNSHLFWRSISTFKTSERYFEIFVRILRIPRKFLVSNEGKLVGMVSLPNTSSEKIVRIYKLWRRKYFLKNWLFNIICNMIFFSTYDTEIDVSQFIIRHTIHLYTSKKNVWLEV